MIRIMKFPSRISLKKFLSALLIVCVGHAGIAIPQASASDTAISTGRESMSLAIGKSLVHHLKDPILRVSIGDTSIADVLLVNNKQIYILGKKSGSTNLNLWSSNNRVTVIDLAIGADTASLKKLLLDLLPDEKSFQISAAGELSLIHI